MMLKMMLSVLAIPIMVSNSQLTQDQTLLSLKARKLPNDICGESNIDEQTIIQDSKAKLGAYPWIAAIGYTVRSVELRWMCGGSLVSDQFVLTVAHCIDHKILDKAKVKLLKVRLGDLDLDDNVNDGASPLDYDIEKALFHPDYDNLKKINDIGLIKLKTKVKFDDLKKPICLPSPEFYEKSFEDYTSVIIGWGRAQNGVSTSLSQAAVEIKDLISCRINLTSAKSMTKVVIDERVFCASSPGADSCQGDSGSPLMMFRKYKGKTKMFLVGIVSYGYLCAVDGYPGVYTRVSSFMEWIIRNIEL